MNEDHRRRLPPVHAVLDRPELADAAARRGREAVVEAVRAVLDEARSGSLADSSPAADAASLARLAARRLASERPHLRPAINATGVLLHTGLGRAPLAVEAVEAVARITGGYSNLEIDLDSGDRGRRASGVEALLRRLTGAEAATVVNNNAAATVLALRALAAGREVIVSRGQLVEIGGSFRLPEIFETSGARLREVGTTNRTRLADYEKAIGPDTAALMRVHPSNFRVVGFTEEVGIRELAELGKSRGLWVIDDIGSGALDASRPRMAAGEPTLAAGLAAGADLLLCSGDKLLGGPQCGILAGSRAAVAKAAADPLMRAFRVDKMTLAALEATLRLALDPEHGARAIPLWASLGRPVEDLRGRAVRLAEALRSELGLVASAVDSTAYLGGGSVPSEAIPSAAVRLEPPFGRLGASEAELARALRLGDPAVVPRIQKGAVLLDLRAVPEEADILIRDALAACVGVSESLNVEPG